MKNAERVAQLLAEVADICEPLIEESHAAATIYMTIMSLNRAISNQELDEFSAEMAKVINRIERKISEKTIIGIWNQHTM